MSKHPMDSEKNNKPEREADLLRHSREITIGCLAKVTQHHARSGPLLPLGKAFCRRANHQRTGHAATRGWLIGLTSACRKLSRLRACGADDGMANRSPSAWMISRSPFFLPTGKSCSSCGSLLVSANGLFFPSAEELPRMNVIGRSVIEPHFPQIVSMLIQLTPQRI